MKMTMHINETLLKSVMSAYDCASKTEAVEMALFEADRRAKLKKFATVGLGFTADELRNAVDPGYDLVALRAAESGALYGKTGNASSD